MNLSDNVKFLEETPGAVGRLGEGLTAAELRRRPEGETFSFAEHVCHLRDIEREGYNQRVRRILSEEAPHLPDIDGTRLAAERDYNSQDVAAGLRDFESARAVSVEAVRGLSDGQLARTGVLEDVGHVSLGRLISMMREHDAEHLDILARLRGKLLGLRTNGS